MPADAQGTSHGEEVDIGQNGSQQLQVGENQKDDDDDDSDASSSTPRKWPDLANKYSRTPEETVEDARICKDIVYSAVKIYDDQHKKGKLTGR